MRMFKNRLDVVFFKMIFGIFVIALFFSRPCAADPAGDIESVVALGASPVTKDVPSAREAAVAQGLAGAVGKTALQILPVERIIEKFDALSALLTNRRDEFIQDYKVLKESNDGKTYRVLVQATVLSEKLKQSLGGGDAAKEEKPPTVLFMISERLAGEPSASCWWMGVDKRLFQPDMAVEAMKRVFADNGFIVMDEKTIPAGQIENLQLTDEITDSQAVEVGKRVKADVVVAGNSAVEETPGRTGEMAMRTFKGIVTVRPVFAGTGEPLPAIVNTQTVFHQDKIAGSRKALSDAGKQAGLAAVPQILAKWKAPGPGQTGGDITITLTGSDILTHLAEFRTALKHIKGVSSHQMLEIGADKATLKVSFDGAPQSLADALVQESFDSFAINVSDVAGSQIQVQLSAQ